MSWLLSTQSLRAFLTGYCDFSQNLIAVRPDVAPAQAVKTLIHELAHALLHGDELPRSKEVAEVEVESVACIVCDGLGVDSGDYSFRLRGMLGFR